MMLCCFPTPDLLCLWCVGLQFQLGNNTHSFNGLVSRTTWVGWYQKDKPFWIFLDDGVAVASARPYAKCVHPYRPAWLQCQQPALESYGSRVPVTGSGHRTKQNTEYIVCVPGNIFHLLLLTLSCVGLGFRIRNNRSARLLWIDGLNYLNAPAYQTITAAKTWL